MKKVLILFFFLIFLLTIRVYASQDYDDDSFLDLLRKAVFLLKEDDKGLAAKSFSILLDASVEKPANIQFEITYDPNKVKISDIKEGSIVKSANKNLFFNEVSPGATNVLIAGVNLDKFSSGTLITVQTSQDIAKDDLKLNKVVMVKENNDIIKNLSILKIE